MRACMALLFALVLAGCAAQPQAPSHTYSLAGMAGQGRQAASGAEAAAVVRVAAVNAPAWLQGRGMCYRLEYADGNRLARYAHSRWSAPVPAMVGEAVRNALAASGDWKAVVGPGDTAQADFTVAVRLVNLCQAFQSPGHSTVRLAARVTVTDEASDAVVAQKAFHRQRPAPSPDAPGGVQGERQAVAAFARDVAAWTAGLDLKPAAGNQRD